MRVAVVGASGLVGRTMLKVLEERNFPVSELLPYSRSPKEVEFRGEKLKTIPLTHRAVEKVDLALFSAGAGVSREFAPRFVKKGAVVIDNSSAWRLDPEVPLVVPEVNPEALREIPKGIVANPNCSTIQLVVALKPLLEFGLEEVFVATYQAVSGAGKRGLEALEAEERGEAYAESPFPGKIHRNLWPAIGSLEEGFYTEEWKLVRETKKILGRPVKVHATAVRVPVPVGHSEAVAARLREKVELGEIVEAIKKQEGLVLREGPLSPAQVAGRDEVFVSRLRLSPDDPRVLLMWVAADNLRKGAATNAVQIADIIFG